MNALQILKNSGDYESFSLEKLKVSLINSGLDATKAAEIAKKVEQKCLEGLSSKKLYQIAHRLLKKESHIIASKYSMTKAISDLGPEGYHFEKFIRFIFEATGYKAITNHRANGCCIKHEIDVKAVGEKTIFCECKFHNNPNTKNDVKTALYVHARSEDLKKNEDNNLDEFWLISNTKFSKDAIEYSDCVGLKLLGPNAPHKQALSELAIKNKVYPVSSLYSLTKKQARQLIDRDIIVIQQIHKSLNILKELGFSDDLIEKILNEIKRLTKR